MLVAPRVLAAFFAVLDEEEEEEEEINEDKSGAADCFHSCSQRML